jgi:hypothetical protein
MQRRGPHLEVRPQRDTGLEFDEAEDWIGAVTDSGTQLLDLLVGHAAIRVQVVQNTFQGHGVDVWVFARQFIL